MILDNLSFNQELRVMSIIQKTSKKGTDYYVVTALNKFANVVQFNVVGDLMIRFADEVKELTRIIAELKVSVYNQNLNVSITDFIVSNVQTEPYEDEE